MFLAGWSSRNKYSLLGAMRGVAQLVSYEVPQVLATIPVLLWTGSLSLVAIMNHQVDSGRLERLHPTGFSGLSAAHDRQYRRGQPYAVRPCPRPSQS